MSKGTYSFTTPIYYVNAAPHLGTAYTTVAADTVARYQRMNGYDVAFVTGMDEHGQKVADTRRLEGHDAAGLVRLHGAGFPRCVGSCSTSPTPISCAPPSRATPAPCRSSGRTCYDKGYCYKGSYEGWYCVHEETYYAESDLEKNEDGEFVCPDCKRPVQKAGGEENWFFKLSEFQEPLLKFYDEQPRLHPPRNPSRMRSSRS